MLGVVHVFWCRVGDAECPTGYVFAYDARVCVQGRPFPAWIGFAKAFRVTPAVTKVDSLLRASSFYSHLFGDIHVPCDSESLSALKSNMGAGTN